MPGASRGVGKGIATSLSESGFSVFATGRTIEHTELHSSFVRIACDHGQDEQTQAAFDRITKESETLDLLVNCAWDGYERMMESGQFTWNLPSWQQPLHRWKSMMDSGVRAAFICSALAAPIMISQPGRTDCEPKLLDRPEVHRQHPLWDFQAGDRQDDQRYEP